MRTRNDILTTRERRFLKAIAQAGIEHTCLPEYRPRQGPFTSVKISKETNDRLEQLKKQTGRAKTAILEVAVEQYFLVLDATQTVLKKGR